MKFIQIFLILIISLNSFTSDFKNTLSIGIDYNSLLYEFERSNYHSFYYNFSLKGHLQREKSFFNYNLAFLYPFSYSLYEEKPSAIGLGNINLRRNFEIGIKRYYEISIFFNFKNSENEKIIVPVEEETFNFYGIENLIDLFSNLKLKAGINFLKTKNYEIFQNKKIYFGAKYLKEKNEKLKLISNFTFSKYYFDKEILTIPSSNDGFPIPELKEHNENVLSFDLGFEYISFYIFDFILFFQKKDATIKDFSNKSIGIEGLFSFNLIRNIDMVLAFRYEKRYLEKKYLFFEPNILTDIGTSYIYIKLKKNIDLKRNLSLVFGRFVHDAREDFFKTENARYKISISFEHLIY